MTEIIYTLKNRFGNRRYDQNKLKKKTHKRDGVVCCIPEYENRKQK